MNQPTPDDDDLGPFGASTYTGLPSNFTHPGTYTQQGPPRLTTIHTKEALADQRKEIETDRKQENRRFKIREIVRDQSRKIVRWILIASVTFVSLINIGLHWIYTHTVADEAVLQTLNDTGLDGDKLFFLFGYVSWNLIAIAFSVWVSSWDILRRKIPKWIENGSESLMGKENLTGEEDHDDMALIKQNREYAIY